MKIPGRMTLSGETELAGQAESKKRQFKQLAHAGSRLTGFFADIIYSLDGMKVPGELPILQQHDHKLIVGLANQNSVGKDGVHLGGELYDTAAAREVAALADQGFKWQASIGVRTLEAEFVEEDEERVVNGRKECGPFVLVSQSEVYESSFVPIGADRNTRSVVLSDVGGAEAVVVTKKEKSMSQEKTATAPAVDPVAEERKRVSQLKLAFPTNPSFALKHIELGSSVLEAKAAYADELQKENNELRAQRSGAPEVPSRGGSTGQQVSRSAVEEWNALLQQELACHKGPITADVRFAAIRKLAIANPKLHQGYLEEYNATRPARARA